MHWLGVELVPKYFQKCDRQATLEGIKSAHDIYAKLRYPHIYTQAENISHWKKKEMDMKVEALGIHIKRK